MRPVPDDRTQVEVSWTHWDALFLVAIVTDTRCNLDTLIYESDARNRSYPTEQEASSTLGRLIASGLISVEVPYFKATDNGRRIVRRAAGPWWRGWWSGGTIEEVDRILNCLREYPLVESTWSFAAGELDEAVQRYVRRTSQR